MTVRELIQKIISEAPNLDAEVYFARFGFVDEFEFDDISNYGSNDGLFFIFKNTI